MQPRVIVRGRGIALCSIMLTAGLHKLHWGTLLLDLVCWTIVADGFCAVETLGAGVTCLHASSIADDTDVSGRNQYIYLAT